LATGGPTVGADVTGAVDSADDKPESTDTAAPVSMVTVAGETAVTRATAVGGEG